MAKKIVKINAKNVKSKFGIIVDEYDDMVLLKVSNKIDREKCVAFGGFLPLGKSLIKEI